MNKILFKIFNIWWKKIANPPKWVIKAHNRTLRRYNGHPYNRIFFYNGKTYRYRVTHGDLGQGRAPILYWERKVK